jgi:DNA-binding MarR family transcriptional regulator
MHLVQLLRSVSVDMEVGRADFARRHGLHPTDVRALTHLLDAARAGDDAMPTWLAGQLGMPSAATTAVIDRLEAAHLVERRRDVPDRRRVRLVLTERAVTLGWSFFGALIEDLVEEMAGFSDAELATAARFLQAMGDATRGPRSGGGGSHGAGDDAQ